MKRIIIFLLGFCLTVVVFVSIKTSKRDTVFQSITHGLQFIANAQLADGEIPNTFCEDKNLTKNCGDGKNYYITASTIYSLDMIQMFRSSIPAETISKKSANYLRDNLPPNYLWRFSPHADLAETPPDLDDTSLISFVLLKHNYKSNNYSISKNINDCGLFYTWLDDGNYGWIREGRAPITSTEACWSHSVALKRDGSSESQSYDDVDPLVNTNVALYLNNPAINSRVCSALSEIINGNLETKVQSYSDNNYALYYAMSRNFEQGISCFGEAKDLIIYKIIHDQAASGMIGENEFTTALALNTLLRFGYKNETFYDSSFKYLMDSQLHDGGWNMRTFYCETNTMERCIGSRSYSTAVSLEAIARYFSK